MDQLGLSPRLISPKLQGKLYIVTSCTIDSENDLNALLV